MRGNDCTTAQLAAAEAFISDFAAAAKKFPPGNFVVRREDLIRLLAWYGAIRYKAGEEGLGTCEFPNEVALLTPEEANRRG